MSNSAYCVFNRVRLVTLGNAGVGKTSIVTRIREENPKPETYMGSMTTIGVDYSFVQLNPKNRSVLNNSSETILKVELWDTAGQERYHAIVSSYLRNGDVFLIVFDCTNQDSFDKVQSWLDNAISFQPKSEIIIVGNKVELVDNESILPTTYGDTKIPIMYISAYTTYNLPKFKQLLTDCCFAVYERIQSNNNRQFTENLHIVNKREQNVGTSYDKCFC